MSYGEPWVGARTLRDFGWCTAQWLEGEADHMPTRAHYRSVSSETRQLVPLLAALNRRGLFITEDSQPACTPKHRELGGIMPQQRAGIMGFVPAEAIARVRAALTLDGVLLNVVAPGAEPHHAMMLVSRRGSRDETWFGNVQSADEIARDYGGVPGNREVPGLHARVIRALQGCYQVTAVDQRWGRNSVLWPALQRLAV